MKIESPCIRGKKEFKFFLSAETGLSIERFCILSLFLFQFDAPVFHEPGIGHALKHLTPLKDHYQASSLSFLQQIMCSCFLCCVSSSPFRFFSNRFAAITG